MSRIQLFAPELDDLDDPIQLMRFVGEKAREITAADGTTFVMREDEHCLYAEENAVAPLWKGQRFHLRVCISGWVMMNKMSAIIDDIYLDTRIPADSYRRTFVRSLAMVPVGYGAPVAAIGAYWARERGASAQALVDLEAFADEVSAALEKPGRLDALQQATAAPSAG